MADRAEVLKDLTWKKFPVLDDGFVCLVDVMGDDAAVAQAARVSYGEGTKTVNDDRGLIRYLMRHRHTTPFEMVEVKLLVRTPMDVWRQWIRHRTANVNEYSTRYSLAIDSAQKTEPDAWRAQAGTNRQGSDGTITAFPPGYGEQCSAGQHLSTRELELQRLAREVYEERIKFGVAREQARKDLPLSTYTEAYWKCDLHNILHFLALRMDSHAQKEIRDYATIVGEQIIRPLFPAVWEAFADYRLNGMFLTSLDLEVITRIHRLGVPTPLTEREFLDYQPEAWKALEKCRERDESLSKLIKLGIVAL